jgi:neopullulanase
MNVLDTHDTPRLMTMLNGDRSGLEMLFTLLFTLPGAPNIFYGSEIGLTGRHDPDCRRAFPWGQQDAWDHDLRHFLQRLIHLRSDRPVLRRGTFTIVKSGETHVIYRRNLEEQLALVAFNAGARDLTVAPWPAQESQTLEEVLAPAGSHLPPGGTVTIPGRTARIWLTPR